MDPAITDARPLRRRFEREGERSWTIGVEEEVMVLDPDSLDLMPRARELLDAVGGEEAAGSRTEFKLELPACQLEIATAPAAAVGELVEALAAARHRLAGAVGARARLAAAGAHPFAAAEGALNGGERYERIEREYGAAVRRQLICGLHVHVGVPGADRALAVYNELRSHLPDLAALGANAPLRLGRDAGMASVRPGVAGLLPRQGVPPAFASWEELAAGLAWGARSGRLESAREWWWELRLHPVLGTIEARVPDAQSTVAEAGALVASVAGLVLWLAARHDGGDLPPAAPSWRIAENRFSAARHGVHGEMVDVRTGVRQPTSERLHMLLDGLAPFAETIGAGAQLADAHRLAERNGADRQREVVAERGIDGVAPWLCARFLQPAERLEQAKGHVAFESRAKRLSRG